MSGHTLFGFNGTGGGLATNAPWPKFHQNLRNTGRAETDLGSTQSSSMSVLGMNGAVISSGEAASAVKGTDLGTISWDTAVTNVLSITNAGTESLSISGWTTNGTGATHFRVVNIPDIVSIGGVSNFSFIFCPSAVGTHTATVHIANNSTNSTYVVYLAGAGAKHDQTITNFPNPGTQVATNTVRLTAQASSGLQVTNFTVASGPAVISGLTNMTFTNSGSVSVTANQAGSTNWNAAPNVTNTFNVGMATAVVTLTNLNQTYDGTPRVVGATTIPGGLSVSITYNGSGSAPTVVGNYAVTGVVNSALYQGSANGTLTVNKADHTITFPTIPDQVTTNTVGLSATASSGLPVGFAVLSGPGSISGGATLAFTGAGFVSIVASQAGNATWNSAANVTNTFTVTKANQTITFPAIPDQMTTSRVTLAVTASSGLAVSFSVESGQGAINGNILMFTGAGVVQVVASQGGNALWNAAANVTNNIIVNADQPPSAPTGVSASDGMYSNKVQVIWNAASGATSYEVWRSTANDSGSAGKLADVALSLTAEERESLTLRNTENQLVLAPRIASPAYDDTSALAGVTYYYWVKTRRASDVSGFSQSDSGYRMAGLSPPVGVVASDGTYSEKVRIVWPIVTGATSYEVWRATVNAAGFAALLGEVGGLECDDTTAQAGTVYYYWVKSKNALETSAFSLSDSGYRSGEIHIQPGVTINGASGEIALRRGDTLSVAIFLMATSGLNADWWVVIAVPGGAWYYFDAYTGGWNPITREFTPTYQGALFDFLAPIELLNMSTTWLPAGAYVFYFGVDTAMNGNLDMPPVLVFDSTTMTLTE